LIKTFGIKLEPEKSRIIENEFKFLGVEFNIEKETAKFRDSSIS